MMTHRSKKPYECGHDGCDKSYCDARSLRRHLENVHHQLPVDDLSIPSFSNEQNTQMFQYSQEYRKQFLSNQDSKQWNAEGQSPGYLTSPISPHPNSPGHKQWIHPFIE